MTFLVVFNFNFVIIGLLLGLLLLELGLGLGLGLIRKSKHPKLSQALISRYLKEIMG